MKSFKLPKVTSKYWQNFAQKKAVCASKTLNLPEGFIQLIFLISYGIIFGLISCHIGTEFLKYPRNCRTAFLFLQLEIELLQHTLLFVWKLSVFLLKLLLLLMFICCFFLVKQKGAQKLSSFQYESKINNFMEYKSNISIDWLNVNK